MSKLSSVELPWGRKSFQLGIFLLGVFSFSFFIRQVQVPPKYDDLSIVSGSITEIVDWKIRSRYLTNSGVDIFISSASGIGRYFIGDCDHVLSQLRVGDMLVVKFEKAPAARVNGRVYEISKYENRLCRFEDSVEESQKVYNEWRYAMYISLVAGIAMVLYSTKT